MEKGGRLNRILIAVATAAAIVAVIICAQIFNRRNTPVYNVELAKNTGFEELDESGAPLSWQKDMWLWDDGVSELSVSDEAFEGEHSLMVANFGENDARYVQEIAVEPDAMYRIACMVRAEGCGQDRAGAGVSVLGGSASSYYVYDSEGEWQLVELFGRTGEEQKTISVALRVGGYSSLNTGRAWFDQLTVSRVESAPAGAFVASLDAGGASGGEPSEGKWASRALWAAFLAYAVAAAVTLRRGRTQGEVVKGTKHQTIFAAVLGGALVLRVIVAMTVRGYGVDMNCFEAWSYRLSTVGVKGFYDASVFCDYPPGYMWALWALGKLRALLGMTLDTPGVWLLIKSVPIACDMAGAAILYILGRKRMGETPALILGAFIAFNPACILDSAAWGQIDSVLILLLLVALLQACEGRWVTAIPAYFLAVLVKPQALLFGPIALAMLIVECALRRDKGRFLARVGIGVLGGVLITLAVALPFGWSQTVEGVSQPLASLVWLGRLYTRTLGSYEYVTINACNLYQLLGLNWKELAAYPAAMWVGRAAYAAAFGSAIAFYAASRKRTGNRRHIFLVCAYALAVIFCFAAKMHERYLFPAILLLAAAYIYDRDARILWAGLLLTLGAFLNSGLVLRHEHLVSEEAFANGLASLLNLGGTLTLGWACADLCLTGHALLLRLRASEEEQKAESFQRRMPIREDSWLHMTRLDYILMAGITLAYSVLAYVNLGVTTAPETYVRSSAAGESVVFELEDEAEFHMTYYGGICNSTFTVETSSDGKIWTEPHSAQYSQSEVFRWMWYTPGYYNEESKFVSLDSDYPTQRGRYIRVTFDRVGMVLYEVAFLDAAGQTLPIQNVSSQGGDGERAMDPRLLIDEQETVPEYPSYLNSTYFDEIYYARTGYELMNGLNVYEWTHPQLGKLLIMVGMKVFGTNPFGWRFMGTLVGVLMLPVMYLLVKQLIKRTDMAAVGTLLLALDCMHFTQTRICTIDSYAVFFIMLMYLFMIRYCQMSFHFDKLWRTLVPLALSGVCMGLGIASKWICAYAGLGLAVLFFYTMARRYIEYRGARQSQYLIDSQCVQKYWRNLGITLGWCVVWFVIVPLLIYYFSFYRYLSINNSFSVSSVWQEQLNMFNYHTGLADDNHWFRSPWYEWPVIAKPMWFYDGNDFLPVEWVSSISCMGNPAVWWGGLAALIFVAVQATRGKGDTGYQYVLIGFCAQFLPWVLVKRSTFIYHYFASVPFIILAAMLFFDWARRKEYKWYKPVLIAYLVMTAALFAGFYPIISGTPMPRDYARYLRWFNWYNYRLHQGR